MAYVIRFTPDLVTSAPDQTAMTLDEFTSFPRWSTPSPPSPHSPAAPREFLTGFGLTQPGTQAAFKVFVVLETGNEAGSPAMMVERPE